MNTKELKQQLKNGVYAEKLAHIYACAPQETERYAKRYLEVIDGLEQTFGETEDVRLFSAPGRTEIGGNHTDHQHGCVLAAGLNLDVIGAVRLNGENVVRIQSEGYPMDEIRLDDLEMNEAEFDKASALIRGIIRKFADMGYTVQGFDAYTKSSVLKGSGMSSSAAFEVLVGTIISGMFCDNAVDAVEIAKIGQYAENVYFGKPSGLMDQMASSVGSVVAIDFQDNDKPVVEKVEYDFTQSGYALCIIDSGADHADLTSEYAMITVEMRKVSEFFGKQYLREVNPEEFLERLPEVRRAVGNDRAVLRALHFFNDNQRAQDEVAALKNGDFEAFLDLVNKSGRSSYMYLQNVFAASMPEQQAVSLALALCDELLGDSGAFRVHGGGFAGTVQAFVPNDMLEEFKTKIEAVLGENMCHVLAIRPVGGVELK
ncbi:MAG TPA: galactokinase [Candidatus Avimonoglobus intestinipullorum]|uniref:Galactokinase n=1 Tax=Candidatus Avimonoglobus intestinipullorum TaxID=2840699 RepID=A0A9D1S769_9FIRM|nr:galactokinase [Candidatus Avimonoglobus intestinipullorum]